ncbi:hypothetical protein G6F57_003572 [Rhizopus arrhizus]|jgi:hypothetical protein|uniref:RNI-like protein n=1 Tax=Rhizopus oryzae TaxID=64495 RepID=A0A9P6XEI2_RHIOR|nr:hypothetical protein G6F23_004122 [Rhizopus arrhizus]KAG1427746.1 hypothetical protein G6F58_000881 [Rhizopus delemar]KAG0766914.1 hypothetical protein G6F24_003226 [Rhizopus arrhizus]KAG0793661.1 hypothetical protein G6F21_003451 [Rhizopus arrhizus]KAG0802175.1 hypothetical protein G6F22_000519 [Rhizopus arrhizus]
MQQQQQAHLALYLPEILSHIFSFLVPNHPLEDVKKKLYTNLFPCLLVNHIWNKNASRIIWKNAYFDDKQYEFNSFLKLATTLQGDITFPTPSLSSSSAFASLAIADASPKRSCSTSTISSYDIDTPECEPETFDKMDSDHLFNKLDLAVPQSARLTNYRHSLRSLTIRKIKLNSLNEPLAKIGELAVHLVHLDIYICDHFNRQTLQPFLKHHNLIYLSLAGCHLISDDSVLQVAQNCPQLEHLDLRACGQVSDISISAIAMHCPRLRHLNVGRIRDREKITIRSIGLIAKHTNASVLGLAGCEVDDTCMETLAHYRGPGLERVSVNSCVKISNPTIYAFIRHCPNLSVFEMKECALIDDWEAVAELVQRKVLLTLCDVQNKACLEWARINGRNLDLKAPLK